MKVPLGSDYYVRKVPHNYVLFVELRDEKTGELSLNKKGSIHEKIIGYYGNVELLAGGLRANLIDNRVETVETVRALINVIEETSSEATEMVTGLEARLID
ncbi:gp47 [Brochothrix phage A9]|uniref:Gp47 n=1 Tax=Brochothrix phage A9 TaxID=857312 RepID=D9J0J4_9CAUD|nr:gp47 [Brochothrix phage A9]ADJ53089.1 gp47 [Brochothrix phage A9]